MAITVCFYSGVGIARTGIPRTTWEFPGQVLAREKYWNSPDNIFAEIVNKFDQYIYMYRKYSLNWF